jgi:hypothetical protein
MCSFRTLQPVGWVERSDTHQLQFLKLMGIAKNSTHPTAFRFSRLTAW